MSTTVTTTTPRTLCVDLDGTLVQTDLLWETICLLLAARPWLIFVLPLWLVRGKAALKEEVASRVELDAKTLPYHPELLAWLEECRADGRRLVLTTASDRRFADAVADHLGIFDDVIATENGVNRSGKRKLELICESCDAFDYVGNARVDLPLWAAATHSYVVNPGRGVLELARRVRQPERVFERRHSLVRAIMKLLRPVQWSKNMLLFVPLVVGHQLDAMSVLPVLLAVIGFSACASATYIINDLTDIASDRRHPKKCRRPLAAGTVPIPLAIALAVALVVGALGTTALLGPVEIPLLLAGYMAATMSYSYLLKEKLFVDVLMLAGLYTYRVVAGGVVAGIWLSHWLLAFSVFLFMSLALAKRYAELDKLGTSRMRNNRRGYRPEDLNLVGHLGPSCGYMAGLVFLLYLNGDTVVTLYSQPTLLWLVVPLYLYWITRVWFLAHRGELSEDPVVFAVKDRVTYAVGLVCGLLVFLAA